MCSHAYQTRPSLFLQPNPEFSHPGRGRSSRRMWECCAASRGFAWSTRAGVCCKNQWSRITGTWSNFVYPASTPTSSPRITARPFRTTHFPPPYHTLHTFANISVLGQNMYSRTTHYSLHSTLSRTSSFSSSISTNDLINVPIILTVLHDTLLLFFPASPKYWCHFYSLYRQWRRRLGASWTQMDIYLPRTTPRKLLWMLPHPMISHK